MPSFSCSLIGVLLRTASSQHKAYPICYGVVDTLLGNGVATGSTLIRPFSWNEISPSGDRQLQMLDLEISILQYRQNRVDWTRSVLWYRWDFMLIESLLNSCNGLRLASCSVAICVPCTSSTISQSTLVTRLAIAGALRPKLHTILAALRYRRMNNIRHKSSRSTLCIPKP